MSYYGCFRSGRAFWILMDYCAHGSLRDLMDHMDQPLEERVVAHVLRGALAGLAYLHSKNIIHRDIKAANILLDARGTPKLADFGVSRQMASTWAKTMSIAGTPLWMAPEVARMQSYTYSVCTPPISFLSLTRCKLSSTRTPHEQQADIWSMGITAIELAEFYPPYAEVSPMKAMILITRNPPPRLTGLFSPALNDFVARCLCKQPEERPDAPTLLQHAFITGTPDSPDIMRPILDFSTTYRLRASRGEPAPALDASVRRLTKRTPPPSPQRGTTTTTTTTEQPQESCDGTVVFHGDDAGAEGSSGTVVFHEGAAGEGEDEDASGTVRIRPTATATATAVRTRRVGAVGSLAQQHDAAKRHLTLVPPTACSSGAGGGSGGSALVSKRDFFFIIVGAVTQMLIAHFLHSLFHGSA